MVVGGEEQIKACGFEAVYNGVGAVELGVSGVAVAVVRAAEGGFQVGNGKIRRLGVGVYIAENRIKVVAAVLLLAGGDDAGVHEHVAGGEHRGGGNRGGPGLLGLGFLRGIRPFCGVLAGAGLLIAGAWGFQAQADDGDVRHGQQGNEHQQNIYKGGMMFTGHEGSSKA